jgi:glycosyltransferase involved in cell wall biosynthesis
MFPFLTGKIEVVRAIHFSNRDNSEFINDIRTPGDKRLWIVHSGRIYRGARSPEPLLRALRELLAEHPDLDAKIVVWLVGEVDSQTCDQIEQWHLGSIVKIVPWVPHDEIQQWMRSADWLLLLGNRGGIQVPSKLYEYLGLRKPILVLQEVAEDEASRIVKDVDAGWVIDNDEQSIIQFFRSFLENQIHYPTYQGAIPVETFSLETNLERYWNMLQQIVQT